MNKLGSGGDARGRSLPPAMRAQQWRPGQSGNPSGHSGLYGETVKLAREAAPDAIRRLIELMGSQDERVAAVACNAILDRAFGKPREYEPEQECTPEQEWQDIAGARARNLAEIDAIRRRLMSAADGPAEHAK